MVFPDSCVSLTLVPHSGALHWQVKGSYTAFVSFEIQRHRIRYNDPSQSTLSNHRALWKNDTI